MNPTVPTKSTGDPITAAEINSIVTAIATKVDVDSAKVLSDNNYTTAEKTKVANTTGVNTGDQDLSGKVDKVAGKQLSTNDYTNTEQTKLAAISGTNSGDETGASIIAKLGYVPVQNSITVNGKALNANITLTADDVEEKSASPTNLYFTAARVLATVLTGIGFVTNAAVLATDTILTAFGKLQAQITAIKSDYLTSASAIPAANITTDATRQFVSTSQIAGLNQVAALTRGAKEATNHIYIPVLAYKGLSNYTGLANHASGGVVAAVQNTTGSGSIPLPNSIDPTKPFRISVLVEVNDSYGVTIDFANEANVALNGALNVTSIGTTNISAYFAGVSTINGYGATTNIAAGSKFWFTLAGDGVNISFSMMPFALASGYQFNTGPAYGVNTNFGYCISKPITTTLTGGKKAFGGAIDTTDYAQRITQIKITSKSTLNRVIGAYGSQSLNGPSDGRLQPPFMMQTTILNDPTGWIVCPGSQGYTPTSLVMMLHANASDPYVYANNTGLSAQRASVPTALVNAGYCIFGVLGSSNSAGYTEATASNWGAATGGRYRKAQQEVVRSMLSGTNNLFEFGNSMGCLNGLCFILQFPEVVKAGYFLSGVSDLADCINNRGFNGITQLSYGNFYKNLVPVTGLQPNILVNVTTNAAIGANTITVSQLPGPIPSGTIITLNTGTGQTQVTLSAGAAILATSITVTALAVAVTTGAVYDMSYYWFRLNYSYSAVPDAYMASPYTWRGTYVNATSYILNDVIAVPNGNVTATTLAWNDPALNPIAFNTTPIKIVTGLGDTLIPPLQSTNFSNAVNALTPGNVIVETFGINVTANAAVGDTSVPISIGGNITGGYIETGTVVTIYTGSGQTNVTLSARINNNSATSMSVTALTAAITNGAVYGAGHIDPCLYSGADVVAFFNAHQN